MITHLGIPFEESKFIEDKCLALCEQDQIFGVISEDLSLLTFGVKKLIRYIDSRHGLVRIITLEDTLSALNLDYLQFVDLCILLGTDYSNALRGVSVSKIYNYILK